MKEVRAFIKPAKENGYVANVSEDLLLLYYPTFKFLQGNIILLYSTDERVKNRKPNILLANETISGTVIFTAYCPAGLVGLIDEQIKILEEKFNSIGGN